MTKIILYILLTMMLLTSLIASPVAAKKRLRLEDLKACAKESSELPKIQEKFKKSRKYTNALQQQAKQLYKKAMSDKKKLAAMPKETQDEIDIYNRSIARFNQLADKQRKIVNKFNIAARKLNIFRVKINKRGTKYTNNCTNIYYRRKHIWIVCSKEEYKNTNFCKQR